VEVFEGKESSWEGLWWHPEYNGFSSAVIDISELRKFKGKIRIWMRKNKYYNDGENGRPNYNFIIRDARADSSRLLKVMEADSIYRDRDGNRLYTENEVRKIICGTVSDVEYGIHDPYDILASDFVDPYESE